MAFDLTPLACDTSDLVHQAEAYGRELMALGGVGVMSSTSCFVSERAGTTNMSVDVAPGHVHVPDGTNTARVYGGANEDVVNVPLSASDPTNDRIDLIHLLANNTAGVVDGVDPWKIGVVVAEGTPGAVPVVPSLPAGNRLALAEVTVPASATSISDADITDVRFVTLVPRSIIYTASTTFTKADYPGLRAVRSTVQGGGGGGAGAGTTTSGRTSGQGGGGGDCVIGPIIPVDSLLTSEMVTVGDGGAAASGAGNPGGGSSFGSHVSAAGGGGAPAPGGQTSGSRISGPGGVGGGGGGATVANGGLVIPGENGGHEITLDTATLSGKGGASHFGPGAGAKSAGAAGLAGGHGTGKGDGGSGAANGTGQTAKASGAGSPGVVILDLFF